MTAHAIETRALARRFGEKRAVDGIDLDVKRGEIFAVLGPNGAGKTTLVRMLATLLRPSGGSASVLGHDIEREAREVRRKISLTGQFASVDEDLTGYENLLLLSRLSGLKGNDAKDRAMGLLIAFDFADSASKQAKDYSGGMRRKLDIASSLIRRPELLFLDEPTTGLDPRSRNQVWDIVRGLAASGTTILLTTQYLEEADQLADEIAVVDHGRIIARGTSAELKAKVGGGVLQISLVNAQRREEASRLLSDMLVGEVRANGNGTGLSVDVADPDAGLAALGALSAAGITLSGYALSQPSLDEVFFALTGRPPEPEDGPETEAAE
ncbi:MAG: ATP-binding cassette domain-containing protein [Oceanicaulis sp.]|uniref:ATP-binding cassette domain-containing protein n=1 Tax=Glycocaulis sp. TaxID=1969725 RepID=UPI0025C33074|nr:ATP-binding cassette domain-containing protein [Glycocaulis sp.]MCC5982423.1 ATP-binding cassette domain-containing protein [Oceanicaulis sp.]MCH8520615.1 ATP-binding cassette domain-containing protein [Glycocaulis sp.]